MKMRLLCVIAALLISGVTFCQPEENEGDPPADVPLDGGISILIGAGLAYGISKMRKGELKTSVKEPHS